MSDKLFPCLWYNGEAKEAASFYCSLFKNSKIIDDTPMVVIFELDGNKFMALNGGPEFKFNESFSMVVQCDTQEDIDYYWDKLTEGGKESQCGWLKDKYGMSWQIVPSILSHLMKDPSKRQAVIASFMKMRKFNIEELQRAANT